MSDDIEFYNEGDMPEELNRAQNRFSVDVLIYCPQKDEHTIGWFDYLNMKWLFLCREVNFNTFEWRYFTDKHDRTIPNKRNNGRR